MSRYDWEQGTITLPGLEVARVKKAVRDAANAVHERRYQEARELWRRYGHKLTAAHRQVWLDDITASDEEVYFALEAAVDAGRAPRREQITPSRATNRTTRFTVALEGSITFDGRQVRYYSGENNHQVERARQDPVAIAFFQALARTKWTRGTGGQLIGNDEYNRDSEYEGGGGNYVTATYGPGRSGRYR